MGKYASLGAVSSGEEYGEDVEPALGLINLADLMLVFACGLMLSIIVNWNIDLGPQLSEIDTERDMREVDVEDMKDVMESTGSGYSEVGTVYQDPKTGQYYILSPEKIQTESNS